MGSSGIKWLIKVMSSFYFATFGVYPVKTVILANVTPFRDKLIYFGCLFNPFMPEEFSKMKHERVKQASKIYQFISKWRNIG